MPKKQAKLNKQAKVIKKAEIAQYKRAQRLKNKAKRKELKQQGYHKIKIENGKVIRKEKIE